MTAARVRVLVHHRAPVDRAHAVREAYFEARELLAGTPGLLRSELLGPPADPCAHVLLMDWASLPDYQAWEAELRRRGHPSPLRPYQDRARPGGHYETYLLTAEYPATTDRRVTLVERIG